MSRKYKFHNPNGIYFISFAVQFWIDLFTRNEYRGILLDDLQYRQQNDGLVIHAWCIMTNHVHLVISASSTKSPQSILRDFKSRTTKKLIEAIKSHPQESRREWLLEKFFVEKVNGYRLWRADNKPIEIWSNYIIDQKVNYLHNNPVEGGFVFKAEEYVYSSARDYAGEAGYLKVSLVI